MNQEHNQQSENQYISDQELDHFFKSELEHHQIDPDASLWAKIKHSVILRKILNISTKEAVQIAATLIFILTATSIYLLYPIQNQSPKQEQLVEVQTSPIQPDSVTPIVNNDYSKSDFVLDIQPDEILEDEEVRAELIEKELDEYLAFLLEDEDEFSSKIDSVEIFKSLKPAEVLDVENTIATIPQLPRKEVITILAPNETEITLPHRFLKDDAEIETYLLIYENNQQKN